MSTIEDLDQAIAETRKEVAEKEEELIELQKRREKVQVEPSEPSDEELKAAQRGRIDFSI